MSHNRQSTLSQGLNLSLEQLKQLLKQLGLAERLVDHFFFFEALVRKKRKSFGVEDLPLFLSDGKRVDLKSIDEIEVARVNEYGRDVLHYWLWISGKKVEACSYNQILDEKFCFEDGEFISDPVILKKLNKKKRIFEYGLADRNIIVKRKKRQVYLYRELDTPQWYLDTGAKIDPSIQFVTVVGARVHISSARHHLDFDHFIERDGKQIQVYTYRQIKGAELYQELTASLALTQNPDLSQTELEADQMDVDEVNLPVDEMNNHASSIASNQNGSQILKSYIKIDDENFTEIEEAVENEASLDMEANQEHRDFLNQYNQDDEDEIEEEVGDPSEEASKEFSEDYFFKKGNENIHSGFTSFDNDNAMQEALLPELDTLNVVQENKAMNTYSMNAKPFSAWQVPRETQLTHSLNTNEMKSSENKNSTAHNAKQIFLNRGLFCIKNTISFITNDENPLEKNRNKKS